MYERGERRGREEAEADSKAGRQSVVCVCVCGLDKAPATAKVDVRMCVCVSVCGGQTKLAWSRATCQQQRVKLLGGG